MKNRNSAVAVAAAMLACFAHAQESAGTSTSAIRDATRAAFSSAVSTGKNLLSGITEGVTSGRDSTQGADGATSISDYSQLKDKVEVEVLANQTSDSHLLVTVGFKNQTDRQLRLINLLQTGSLIVIEKSGYSTPLAAAAQNPDQITIPAKSGVRQQFSFEKPADTITAVRLWGRDWAVKPGAK